MLWELIVAVEISELLWLILPGIICFLTDGYILHFPSPTYCYILGIFPCCRKNCNIFIQLSAFIDIFSLSSSS